MAKKKSIGVPKKKPAASAQSKAAVVAAPKVRPGKILYEMICSECYTEFDVPSGFSAERIACPECMHVGAAADPEVMTKIAVAKRGERSALIIAVIPALLLLASGIGWITYLLNTGPNAEANINYAFGGASFLLLVALLVLAFKYEGKRYEVYF